jgi:pyruvate dehydrogenase E2 component (dihydrolipoamide acetyltransferase)
MDVVMPKLSDTMEEGKILRWLKHEGDVVKAGDLLAEVETDKANMDIEAFDEGVVAELRVKEGESAPVGAVIAVLSSEAGAAQTAKPAAAKPEAAKPAPKAAAAKPAPAAKTVTAAPKPSAKPAGAPSGATGADEGEVDERRAAGGGDANAAETGATEAPGKKPAVVVDSAVAREAKAATPAAPAKRPASDGGVALKASPLARKLAAERGVDLRSVRGSGPGGRIVEKDLEGGDGGEASAPAARPAAARPAAGAPAVAERRMLSRIRKTTATRMAEAKRDVPHFYVSCDLDVGEAMRLRDELVGLGETYEGLTITHLLLRACGLALRRVPEMNASYDGDAVVLHERANIGLATATDAGLLVPVVHDCDANPLATIVAEARAVVSRARAGKPAGEDLTGATFSVSNLGMFPVAHFAAVVNPPQAAILAVGTIRAVPVVRNGEIVPGHLMTVTLSCDHRAVDGALAGRFLEALKPLVEQPIALVV